MGLREIKRDAITYHVRGVCEDHHDARLFQRGLMSVIRAALDEPGSTIAADLKAIGVTLPGTEPVEVHGCVRSLALAALSGAIIGSGAIIAIDFFI